MEALKTRTPHRSVLHVTILFVIVRAVSMPGRLLGHLYQLSRRERTRWSVVHQRRLGGHHRRQPDVYG